jgi:hypothetical protein
VISAIALPLFLEEISNRQWYTSGRLDNASSKPSCQVTNESFKSASTAAFSHIYNWAAEHDRKVSIINQHGLAFRDQIWTSLDGSPLLQSRESFAPSPGDARTERPSNSASEKSRLSLRSISNLWDARTVRPTSSPPIVSRQTVSTPALKKDNLPLYKLVVLGDGGVGKTELTIQVKRSTKFSAKNCINVKKTFYDVVRMIRGFVVPVFCTIIA